MYSKDQAEQQFINVRQIQGILERIYAEAATHGVYMVEDSGFLIVEAGELDIDKTALSALVAASFGAIEEIAKLLGEKHFSQLTQQADNRHLFISKAGKRHILITVFGKETNLGLVKLYVEKAVIHLAALLDYEPPVLKKVSVSEPEILESEDEQAEEFSTEIFDQMDDQSEGETDVDDDLETAQDAEQETSSLGEGDIVPEGETEEVNEDMDIAVEIEALLQDNLGLETSQEEDETITFEETDPASDEDETSLDAIEEVEPAATEEETPLDEQPVDDEVLTTSKSDEEGSLDSAEQPTLLDDDFDLEEEVEEDLDPEISRLTEELKSEIAQLREESKILEQELAQSPAEEEVEQPEETEPSETLSEDALDEEQADVEVASIESGEDGASEEELPDEDTAIEDDGDEEEDESASDDDAAEEPESHESDDDSDLEDSSSREQGFPSWLDD